MKKIQDLESEVKKHWWWRSDGKIKPEEGLQIRLWENASMFPARLMPGGVDHQRYLRCEYSNFAHAAFSYEIEARVRQVKVNARSPIYRHGIPFPKLTQVQKKELQEEFPSQAWRFCILDREPWPNQCPSHIHPDQWIDISLERKDTPPEDTIDIHIQFKPSDVGKREVMDHLKKLVNKKLSEMPPHLRKQKRRRFFYPWETLELIDKKLLGIPLITTQRNRAMNLLSDWKNTFG